VGQDGAVAPRHRPLGPAALLFAHRGARAHATENTIEAFRLAVRLGATGLETDVWVTEDGVPVLDHDGVVGRVRKRPIRSVVREELPPHVPSLEDLYRSVGTALPLSIDVKDPNALEPLLEVARRFEALPSLWLCHPDHRTLSRWRDVDPVVHLVDSTSVRSMDGGPERRAAVLRDAGIDAVNLHRSEWSAGLVTLFHRFGRQAWGWDAQHERMIVELLHMGADGVFSDHVDRLVDAARAVWD
jgi:glycerophosphoryl diester phosphodiesterase